MALLNAGIKAFRFDEHGRSHAPLCGMGSCMECRATIDGVFHQRTCLVIVQEGMRIEADFER